MSEKTISVQIDSFRCAASCCCILWFVVTCAFVGVFGWSYSEWVSGVPFRPEEACRLTYADDSLISEKEMRKWAGMEGWILKHPHYDVSKRACVCSSDLDPSSNSGDTPAWIAPGDLVALYKEGVYGKRLPADFVNKYKNSFSPEDHIKVCIDQERLTTLWNGEPNYCHTKTQNGTVASIFTGWDGALYCAYACTREYDQYCCDSGEWTCECPTRRYPTNFRGFLQCPSYTITRSQIEIVWSTGIHGSKKYICENGKTWQWVRTMQYDSNDRFTGTENNYMTCVDSDEQLYKCIKKGPVFSRTDYSDTSFIGIDCDP